MAALALPDELLVQILQDKSHDRRFLAATCLVSRRLRRIVLPWLYCSVSHFKNIDSVLSCCDELCLHPELCLLVKDLDLTHNLPVMYLSDERVLASIRRSLELMTNLKSLTIPSGYPSVILTACAFQLNRLSCMFDCDHVLEAFFRSQRSLTELRILGYPSAFWTVCSCRKDADILPRLTVIQATVSWLEMLVPLRPVHTVHVLDLARWTTGFLSSSAGPITSLSLPRPALLANWSSVVQQLQGPIANLVVTEMSINAASSLLIVLSNARVLKPENLTLVFQKDGDWNEERLQTLYLTMQMFLNAFPPSLKKLEVSWLASDVWTTTIWQRHPILGAWVMKKDQGSR